MSTFFRVSDLEKARQKVFIYAIEHSNTTLVDRKIYHLFNNRTCSGKVNLAVGIILKRNTHFYAHENNTLFDRSKLACIRDDMAKQKDNLYRTDKIESCSRNRMNSK